MQAEALSKEVYRVITNIKETNVMVILPSRHITFPSLTLNYPIFLKG